MTLDISVAYKLGVELARGAWWRDEGTKNTEYIEPPQLIR